MTTLVLVYMAPLILHTREKVVDVLRDAPVQYAQMHGQGVWARVRFHVVKNSLVPALVLHLASFAELFSGSMLAETLFNYPGLGQTVVKAGLTMIRRCFWAQQYSVRYWCLWEMHWRRYVPTG